MGAVHSIPFRSLRKHGILAAVAMLLSACVSSVPAPEKLEPLTVAEATELGQRFIAAASPCDAGKIDGLFDVEHFMRTVVADDRIEQRHKRSSLAGMRTQGLKLGREFCGSDPSGMTFTFLRTRPSKDGARAIVRGLGTRGLNYYEIIGAKAKDGSVRIIDLFIHLTGERLTETMASTVAQALVSGSDALAAKSTIDAMNRARLAGNLTDVRKYFSLLPASMQKIKAFRLIELTAAMGLEAPDYGEVIARYLESYPDDPSVDFVSIDQQYLRKDVPALLATLDRVEKRAGGDPYVDHLRVSGLLLDPTAEHMEEAIKRAQAVTTAMPEIKEAWWNLLAVQLHRKDHTAALATMSELTKRFALTFDPANMAREALYTTLLASPEYAEWAKAQAGKAAE